MEQLKIFVSVGSTANDKQEEFVKAIENRLSSENLICNTVGRNRFSSDSPLKSVIECMNESSGAIIIALERTFCQIGLEKRGGSEEITVKDRKYATPWNQIEAALAYSRGLPIMVIVERGVEEEGLLEKGYDWYVMSVKVDVAILNSQEFNGVLSSWKEKVISLRKPKSIASSEPDLSTLSIGDLVKSSTPAQLWTILGAFIAALAGAFAMGAGLFNVK